MIESLHDLADWLRALPPVGVYGVLAAVAYLENVVPPIPGDALVVFAGSLVGLGVVAFAPVVALATAASVLGFWTLFAVGRRLGRAVDDPTRFRWLPRGPVVRVEAWLRRWGYGVVAANRFLAGARSVISLMAGVSDLRTAPTLAWAAASAAVWNGLLVAAGYAVGHEWERVLGWLAVYGKAVTLVLATALAAVAVRAWLRARRAKETAKTPPDPATAEPDG